MNPDHSGEFNLGQYILHHVQDMDYWNMPFGPSIPLPGMLSMHRVMVILCAILLSLIFCVLYRKKDRVPTGLTNFLESIVVFVRDEIAVRCLGQDDGRKMTPLFCTFFFFILGLNLLGMVPSFTAATSDINVTGALAVITLCFMIFGAIYKHGLAGFIKALIPAGVPVPVIVLLLPIEFLGLFIKSFVLMIRLFANMLAGHIVLLSLIGLVVILGAVALPAVLFAVFISLLEVMIAFLQAFIFTFLSAIFIGQLYHPAH